jgi:2-hydroxychromene-2-carboxylate isomerase
MTDMQRDKVPSWFDPLCPWAWITSRWLLEVAKVQPVGADWRIMPLAYLHLEQRQGESPTEEYRALVERAWGPVRACAADAEHAGDQVLAGLYTAIGTRLHNQRRRDDPAVLTEALAEVGLPEPLAAAVTSTQFDQRVEQPHHQAFDEVGLDAGTPLLRIRGTVLFGPVITPTPRGKAAGQLWDGVVLIAGTDGFFELKRSRTRKASFE